MEPNAQCTITYPDGERCDRQVRAGGLCTGHMERRRKFGDPLQGGKLGRRHQKGAMCQIGREEPWRDETPCEREHYSLGFCSKHYERYRAHGDPTITLLPRDHGDTCSLEFCERPWFASGMCQRHYNTARLHEGDPYGGIRANDVAERLRRRIVQGPFPKKFYNAATGEYDGTPPCPCRDWTGTVDRPGGGHRYGVITIGNDRFQVHRVVYEREVGPIPEGLSLDHLCCRTRCCEPRHLEPVTPTENTRRRWLVVNAVMAEFEDDYDEVLDYKRQQLQEQRRNSIVWPDDNRSDVS